MAMLAAGTSDPRRRQPPWVGGLAYATADLPDVPLSSGRRLSHRTAARSRVVLTPPVAPDTRRIGTCWCWPTEVQGADAELPRPPQPSVGPAAVADDRYPACTFLRAAARMDHLLTHIPL
ncbi:hypothetical protein AURDEDRAFT_176156 [Auricularia subglabra TFB-10046 SS5]|uniref:Uncharacterized protein n=1 Tax=Auricularia subglabra (strain TFB-10046 / SS5) TaxID=717982 RepID=J0D745_AURST|nr:hypothetical protein AURDEDRAFT_176156 [Auricularia subglabra TFB-10046 SS5]